MSTDHNVFLYLAQPGTDPRKEIAEKLLGEIPEGACVLVYNMAFEKRVLKELGESLPGLRKRLSAVAERMFDLMEPFRCVFRSKLTTHSDAN